MTEEICQNCGHKPLEHPWLQCKKFVPKNHSLHSGVTPVKKGEKSTSLEDTPSGNTSNSALLQTEGTSNLSDKITKVGLLEFVRVKHVKEFIAKEFELFNLMFQGKISMSDFQWKFIKEAGDKLIK